MYLIVTLRAKLSCSADSVWKTPVADLFVLPSRNCFPTFCHFDFFTAVWKFLLQLSTTDNLCIFWRRKFQLVSTHTISSLDKSIMQKWYRGSPNTLCKSTKFPFTRSTKTSIEIKICLSKWNHLVSSFLSKLNLEQFSIYRNTSSDSDRNKKIFFSLLVYLKSMWIPWKNF